VGLYDFRTLGACDLTLSEIYAIILLVAIPPLLEIKDKKMAKKESKVVKASNDVNDELVRELSASFNVNLEKAWWVKARKMVEGGAISVRGLKATIKKVEDTFGNAPTLRSTWSQYFSDAFKVEDLEGGKAQSLKAILNLTIQATRKAGGREGFEEAISGVKSFSEFAKKVEKMPKKESNSSDEPSLADLKAAMAHADGVILLALTALRALSGDEALIRDFSKAEELAKVLKAITANSRAVAVAHPVSA